MQGASLAHAPSGAQLVGSAYGAPASAAPAGISAGAELVATGVDYIDEEPERCLAYRPDGGRCKNGHKDGSEFCGIHIKQLEE